MMGFLPDLEQGDGSCQTLNKCVLLPQSPVRLLGPVGGFCYSAKMHVVFVKKERFFGVIT